MENVFAMKIVSVISANAMLFFAVNCDNFIFNPFNPFLTHHKSSSGMNGKCGNGKCIHEIDHDTGSCKMSCDCEPGKVSHNLIFALQILQSTLNGLDRKRKTKKVIQLTAQQKCAAARRKLKIA